MEVSALRYSAGVGLHGRSPLLRLQSDERLVALTRRGNTGAFETLVARYEARLLAFCRHLLGSREDAEDVLQEVLAAAYNAMIADERAINVRPWLYRIARNRSLNHMRRARAIGVDSMDVHLSEHGATTADKVHEREEFRLLVDDIHGLAETQRTALVLREMDALSYDQIAEAMDTTVPAVKSLLVRARVSLAESAEARALSCEQVRQELGEVAEGLAKKPGALARRHLRGCDRCTGFQKQLRATNRALALVLPIGPLVIVRRLALAHLGLGHSAGSSATAASGLASSGAAGTGAATAGAAGAAGGSAVGAAAGGAVSSGGSLISAGVGALATKAAAGFAAAALVTAGAVEVGGHRRDHSPAGPGTASTLASATPTGAGAVGSTTASSPKAGSAASTLARYRSKPHVQPKGSRKAKASRHLAKKTLRQPAKTPPPAPATTSTTTTTATTTTTTTPTATTTGVATTTSPGTTTSSTPPPDTDTDTDTTQTTTTPAEPSGSTGTTGTTGASASGGGSSDTYTPPRHR